jgi:hypothetical protein
MVGDIVTALVFALASIQGGEADRLELTNIQQQLAAAWVADDRAVIERVLAPEWCLTGLDGRISTRADVLRDVFETRTHRILAVTVDDVRVRVFGDAAVVTGRTHGRGEFARTPYDVVIRFTDTFVRREGRWQAVASHASLVTK